jgi:nucleotide-binding universal stress UspA family protein
MYKQILLPTDGSRLSRKAATRTIALAKSMRARLSAFHASPEYPLPVYANGVIFEPLAPEQYRAQCKVQAERIPHVIAVKARAARVSFGTAHAFSPSPWAAILAAAKKQRCDAIVMASHGRRGVSALVLGSETQKALTHSKLPVRALR